MKHAWTNEWNNSFVDNVSGGVQSLGRGGGETQGTVSLLSSLLHQFFQHMGGQFLTYGYIILKVKSFSFSYSE